MKQEQTATNLALPEQPAVTSQRPRRAGRKALPGAVIQKAWLVLLAALAMTILEGAFRKWVPLFGEGMGKYLMYFSKDIIFALVLFFPKRGGQSEALATLQRWLIPGCVILTAGISLSCIHGINPVGAALSFRADILLPVMALLAVPRLAGLSLRWVIWLLAAFTVLNCGLGLEQNRLPQGNFLNRYAADTEQIADYAGTVRAAGTFAYIAGMATISSLGIWTGLAWMGLPKTQRQRFGAWITLTAGFGCGLATISRAPIVIGLAMMIGWAFGSKDRISTMARGATMGIFCLIVATGIGITPDFSNLGEKLMQRSETSSDSFQGRAFGQLGETVTAIQMAPLGNGFGTEQVAGTYYATGQMGLNHFENPLPRLVMETGILGLIGYLVICAGAILALQTAKRQASNAGARGALLATQLLLLPMFYSSVLFNHTASAFVWMIFAAVLAAAEVQPEAGGQSPEDRNEQPKRRRPKLGRAVFSVTGGRKTDGGSRRTDEEQATES